MTMLLNEQDESIDPDTRAVAGVPRASARIPLDRDRIVKAAVSFIDAEGLSGLTMRRLGASLDVEAMSLYRYVPGREDLLDAVVDHIIDEMYDDVEVVPSPQNGWQDFLQRLAHGVRRVALTHPKAFPLVASRPPEAPWLRPPLRSLPWVETFLEGLTSEGFDEQNAVAAYRAFTSFLLGHLLLEVASLGAEVGPLDTLDSGQSEDPDLTDFPMLKKLKGPLSEDHAGAEFEESLENLLDRISLLRASKQKPPKTRR